MNVATKLIPPKTTSYLQPLDVSDGVNTPFKAAMRKAWQDWLIKGDKEFTPTGNRKKPSYDVLLQMVSESVESIPSSVVINSFQLCGVAEFGNDVTMENLNSRLRDDEVE